jgi:hypothetical protein
MQKKKESKIQFGPIQNGLCPSYMCTKVSPNKNLNGPTPNNMPTVISPKGITMLKFVKMLVPCGIQIYHRSRVAVANATAEILWVHICLLIMCFTPERTEHIEINYHLERRGGLQIARKVQAIRLQMASRRRFLHGS